MLRATFNLSVVPFTKDIDTHNLFPHEQFAEMTKRLRLLCDNRGIGLFTGDVGCGKSTAVRTVTQGLSAQAHKVVYLCRGLDNPGAFYTLLASQLDIVPKFRKTDVATQTLAAIGELYSLQRICTVLIIDEAHLLKADILDEVRLLHNANFDSTDMLATALVGQPSLRKTVELNKFLPLRQRISVSFHLGPLSRDTAYKYFEHQLALAKANTKIFMDNAVETIISAAKGIPRVINAIALKAMVRAADSKMTIVDQETVLAVMEEMGLK